MAFKTAHELSAALAAGETTSEPLTRLFFARIDELEPGLHAFNTLAREQALEAARASDRRRAEGKPLSSFDGVPIALKDNICTKGIRTTCSSKILESFDPPYDATVARKLTGAGCVFLGKTNLDEFAMGSSTENSGFETSRNPWDTNRVPGGSSGGSATAVAAGLTPWALGTDTGGSIRQPAALCGIVGLKPTYGLVSRSGLVAYASSLDQIGPMTLDVEDAAHLLGLIGGHDPKDSTSANIETGDFAAGISEAEVAGLRIGRPKEYFQTDGVDPEVRKAVDTALEKFAGLGAEIVDIEMPHTKYSVAAYYLVATAEASSNLARYDGAHYGSRAAGTKNIVEMFSRTRAEGFGDEVKRRIMIGTYALSAGYYEAYYLKAMKVRTLIKQDFDKAFEKCDLIAGPTSPFPAFKIGERIDDPLQMYLCDIFTLSLNLSGYCGLSMPCGFTETGLPIGFQLQAGAFKERDLLRAAWQLENVLGIAGSREPALR